MLIRLLLACAGAVLAVGGIEWFKQDGGSARAALAIFAGGLLLGWMVGSRPHEHDDPMRPERED